MHPLEFHAFSDLPKEIRLQIWKHALPSPRLIEIFFSNKNDPTIQNHYGWHFKGEWIWASSPIPRSSLLDVVDEARRVLLESYEQVSISNEVESNSSTIFVDFARDTLLLKRLAIDCLVDMASEWNASIRKFPVPGWVSQVQNLAVITHGYRSWAPDWAMSPFLGLSAVRNQVKNQEKDVDFLISVFETFPRLKLLCLVIDGRKPGVDVNDSVTLSEPTDEHEDYYEENGRIKALEWVQKLQSELKLKLQTPRDCSLRLSLLITGEDTAELERRWDYINGGCRFCAPEYIGHRPWSTSPQSSRRSSEVDEDDSDSEDSLPPTCSFRDPTSSDDD
jgi:hypothetical protein